VHLCGAIFLAYPCLEDVAACRAALGDEGGSGDCRCVDGEQLALIFAESALILAQQRPVA